MTNTKTTPKPHPQTAEKHSRKKPKVTKRDLKLSRTSKPAEMSLQDWQAQLRKQFGREQKYKIQNLADHPVFSSFRVTNPDSKSAYRVTIRGASPGDNACTCMDFTTNALGTCKHIEFTLGRLERRKTHKKLLAQGYKPAHPQITLRYGAKRQVQFTPGNPASPALLRLAASYFDSHGFLLPDALPNLNAFISQAYKLDPNLHCQPEALDFSAQARDAETRTKRIDAAYPKGTDDAGLDLLVKAKLYPYQKQGALFAAKAGRCLIGDEMGLGKTIQAIAGAQIMAKLLGVQRVLIISPTSLKHQWEREILKFTGKPATVISGLRGSRAELFQKPDFIKITNYDTLHTDLDLITRWSPDLVILDEAQRIKNWNTRAAKTVKRISTPYAIVLTGTPLENRLQELVSIVEFIDAHRLGPTYKFLADHQVLDEKGKVVGYKNLNLIGQTLQPILLRRQKSQVLTQLPERLDKNFFVPMSPEQRRHHEENKETVARIVHKWRTRGFLTDADQRKLMIALQNMRMSCDSSYLLDETVQDGVKPDEFIQLLDEILETPTSKVVVFSQWLKMHELISEKLQNRKIGHVLFHGGIPSPKRKDLIDRFRDDDNCKVFLSTDAGGVGLNLQFASNVVNMDLPWNPAVLEQRIGRVHRMGQKNPVRVVNFVAQGTIEEGMLSVIKFKKSLFAGALDGGESQVFFSGSKLKSFIETVERATTNIPTPPPAEPILEPETPNNPITGNSLGTPTQTPSPSQPFPPSPATQRPAASPTPPAYAPQQAWAKLLETGFSLFTQALTPKNTEPSGAAQSIIRTDPNTGSPYLHIPMPQPQALEQFLTLAGQLLSALRENQSTDTHGA